VSTAAPRQRPARSTPGPLIRTLRSWRALGREQRVTAAAALALWITMFLPWYSESGLELGKSGVRTAGISMTAWGAFSWVEAAVLLVSIAVLWLLFARGEGRAFHLPGGDGFVVMVAGGWTTLLIIYRMFDKQSTKTVPGAGAITTGIEWGIFFALFAAIWLTWTGISMRRIHRAEPALAADPSVHLGGHERRERDRDRRAPLAATATRESRPRRDDEAPLEHRGVTREDAEQLSFDLPDDRHGD
jgi:hypothetical protein